ncbi:MAG: BMP family ABC transporter substrate-binding protein [Clostridiales bacterium]|nr:BMP family ABC transporter substrate-binding protein [Clostridiales bacterium]
MKKISRRDFLRGSVAGVAAAALGAMPGTALAEEGSKKLLFFTAFIGDFGLSDMGYSAAQEVCEEYGWDMTLVEYGSYDAALAVNSFYDALETTHYDYFLGPDWYISDILNDTVAEYPDTTFILYDTGRDTVYEGDNIYGISFAQNESSFVAAILQAEMTKVGKIGVLSTDSPILNDFSTGWLAGARYAQNDLGLDVEYLHAYLVETSMSAVYEQMNVMYDSGCDVVWPITAQMMLGAAQAAEEHGGIEEGYFIMGCDYDQYSYFKSLADEGSESAVGYENILTSITKNIAPCAKAIIDSVESGDGSIETGNRLYGVAEDGVGILENDYYLENTPEEVREVIYDIIDKIGSGEIEVPSYYDFDTYEEFEEYRDQ